MPALLSQRTPSCCALSWQRRMPLTLVWAAEVVCLLHIADWLSPTGHSIEDLQLLIAQVPTARPACMCAFRRRFNKHATLSCAAPAASHATPSTGLTSGTPLNVHPLSKHAIPTACVALGAWLGALPSQLDWGQWWQVWPIPALALCPLGALCGCTAVWLLHAFPSGPGLRRLHPPPGSLPGRTAFPP